VSEINERDRRRFKSNTIERKKESNKTEREREYMKKSGNLQNNEKRGKDIRVKENL